MSAAAAQAAQSTGSGWVRLPEALPEGERLLWQGSPDWRAFARQVFWTRAVAFYFGAIVLFQAGRQLSSGEVGWALWSTIGWSLLPALLVSALLHGMAWLHARTTLYTLTDRRILMQFGIAIPVALNVPLSQVLRADLRTLPGGRCDVTLELAEPSRMGFLLLWPHARLGGPAGRPRHVLRCLESPEPVASQLASALARTLTDRSGSVVREDAADVDASRLAWATG